MRTYIWILGNMDAVMKNLATGGNDSAYRGYRQISSLNKVWNNS